MSIQSGQFGNIVLWLTIIWWWFLSSGSSTVFGHEELFYGNAKLETFAVYRPKTKSSMGKYVDIHGWRRKHWRSSQLVGKSTSVSTQWFVDHVSKGKCVWQTRSIRRSRTVVLKNHPVAAHKCAVPRQFGCIVSSLESKDTGHWDLSKCAENKSEPVER